MRFIRGVVIASWKLYPIPRAVAWNMAASAIFVCSYGSCFKTQRKRKSYCSLYLVPIRASHISSLKRTEPINGERAGLRQHFLQNIVPFTFDIRIVKLWDMQLICTTWQENLIVLSHVWRYHSQWGKSEAWLLLVENYTQYPAQWHETWTLAQFLYAPTGAS